MDIRQTGRFIQELRKERNMTQKDLAKELKVSDKAVSRWETGRGLPDADSLIALSSFFSVSINEFLLGRRSTIPEKTVKDEADMAVECLKTAKTKKRLGVWIAVISTASILLLALVCLSAAALYKGVTGSADCVIAEDYSYITVFGNKYVPFDIKENTCAPGTVLISEAQVENAGFFAKLFFSDKIQLVKGCDQSDFLYLNSEYEGPSEYYCLESSVDKYIALMNEPKEQYAAEIITKDWDSYDLILDEEIVSAVLSLTDQDRNRSVNCEYRRINGEDAIAVYAKQSAGPFRHAVGELLYKNGGYYWFDYSDLPADRNNEDHSGIAAYDLPEGLNGKLNALFERMFK